MSFWENQKVLVTGATGFVGTNLLRALLNTGARIRATAHTRPRQVADSRIEYLSCDLTNAEDCRIAVEGVEYVFHCAASTSGAAVIARTPLIHVTPNVVMNALLLEAAHQAGVRKFLWLGSSTGYPPFDDHPLKEDEMMLSDPYEKYFCVGWMKRFTEVLCQIYATKIKDPMTTIVLRPTNIYGPYDDFEFATSHVMAALIRRVVERHQPITVWGTGEDVRDLIYIDDFIEVMIKAMEQVSTYDYFNIGLGRGYSVKEILSMVLEIDGYRDARVVFDPSLPTTIPKRLVDISKAATLLGFRPKIDIREGIVRTIRWFRERTVSPS